MFALDYSTSSLEFHGCLCIRKGRPNYWQRLKFQSPLVFVQVIRSEVTPGQHKEGSDRFTAKKWLRNLCAK